MATLSLEERELLVALLERVHATLTALGAK
jgi:hypothetical protein